MTSTTAQAPIEKLFLAWPDLGVGVRFWPCVVAPRHVIDFEVIEEFGKEQDGSPIWGNDEGPSMEPATSWETASVYLSGGLKWDGCINMQFDAQDRAMLHFCGKKDAMRLGAIMERIYDHLGPIIPAWDR